MSRQKKLVNKTNIPEYALERFARCLYPQMVADFLNEDIQREFAEWQAEQHIPHSGDGLDLIMELPSSSRRAATCPRHVAFKWVRVRRHQKGSTRMGRDDNRAAVTGLDFIALPRAGQL